VIRDNPFGYDIGYTQVVENHRGELLVLDYLAMKKPPARSHGLGAGGVVAEPG
jgi:hypothetical protein